MIGTLQRSGFYSFIINQLFYQPALGQSAVTKLQDKRKVSLL